MEMYSEIGSSYGENNCDSSKYGEVNYSPYSCETPVDNDVLAEISLVREVMADVNFGEDKKNVSYIVMNIFFLGCTIWIGQHF